MEEIQNILHKHLTAGVFINQGIWCVYGIPEASQALAAHFAQLLQEKDARIKELEQQLAVYVGDDQDRQTVVIPKRSVLLGTFVQAPPRKE